MNNREVFVRPEIRRLIADIQILPELLSLWQADREQLEAQLRPLRLALEAARQHTASQIAPTLLNQKQAKKQLPRTKSDCLLVLSRPLSKPPPF